jgi:glycosyltransferase involved in cell wall biosynthesis
MNIAVFIKKTTFHSGYGGLEVQNKLLCEGLTKRGHKVTVFSPKNDVTENEKMDAGIRYLFIDSVYKYFRSSADKNSWFNRSYEVFKKEHATATFDIVIGQSSAAIGIISRKKELKVKVISIAHGSTMGELKTYFINNLSLKNLPRLLINTQYSLRQFFGRQRQFVLHSNKVVAVSNAVKKQLIEETFPPENLITVIHNGVEPFDLANDTKPLSKKLIYVGQVTKDKGIGLFLSVIKDLRFKDFELDIIGDGDLIHSFREINTEHNNVLKINLLGKLTHDQTIQKLKSQHGAIFVFPTNRIEGFPMVLVEAMLAGLPVVAYDLGGVTDAVKDGETGYVIPHSHGTEFINKVLELADDPVRMEHMGKNARKIATENFSLSVMLDKYENVIKETLNK